MDFGMFTDFHIRPNMTQAEAFEESFQQVEAAEQLGMDAVWLAEHHFSPDRSVLASPLVIASAIAARTSRIRIGLAVQVLPLTNPLRIAEEAATVDHISKGRFNFGIGRSGLTKYYEGYNVPYGESRGRFLEALSIILKAWDKEQFSHEGTYFSFHDVTVVPKPLQQPYPPIRVALASPRHVLPHREHGTLGLRQRQYTNASASRAAESLPKSTPRSRSHRPRGYRVAYSRLRGGDGRGRPGRA